MTDKNEQVFGLFRNDIKRIERQVKRLEQQSLGGSAGSPMSPVGGKSDGFYAKITGQEDDGWKYSWTALYHQDIDAGESPCELVEYQQDRTTGSTFATYDDEDNHYAVEAVTRSSWIPIGSKVWMYNVPYQPYFVFDYPPRTLIAKSSGEIPARSGITLGYADDAIIFQQSLHTLTLNDEVTMPIRVYNILTDPIPSGKWMYITFVANEGVWHCTGLECD